MNRGALRKIAAATAVICANNGGRVSKFFLMKALYLADRQMLQDYGVPITGDSYSSMPKGPILCAAYDLVSGKFRNAVFQQEWDGAFSRVVNDISPKGPINTDCLSQAEEEILSEKIRFLAELDRKNLSIADWMHKNCPEWETVPKGSSKPISITKVLRVTKGVDDHTAKAINETITDALNNREESSLSTSSLLAVA